jgi:hypothetical protein
MTSVLLHERTRTTPAPVEAARPDPSSWLTIVLRPAGEVGVPEAARLARALVRAAAGADAVILDLRAVRQVPDLVRAAADDASALLTRRGGALLVLDPEGRHHVGGAAVEIGPSLLPLVD